MRILAGGAFLTVAGNLIHVHQSTISRSFARFLEAILSLRSQIVAFPTMVGGVKEGDFHKISGFPGVTGCAVTAATFTSKLRLLWNQKFLEIGSPSAATILNALVFRLKRELI